MHHIVHNATLRYNKIKYHKILINIAVSIFNNGDFPLLLNTMLIIFDKIM